MSVGRRYLLDANVFIEAANTYYGFDICPGFWVTLLRQNKTDRVFSIDKVRAELLVISDQLQVWVEEKSPDTFFKQTADQRVADAFRDLVQWVQRQAQFTPEAKAEFASVADGWVVAYAKVSGLVVVTHEEFAPDVRKKVPVPNVCLEFDVEYCNTFEMLRDLKVRFLVRKHSRG